MYADGVPTNHQSEGSSTLSDDLVTAEGSVHHTPGSFIGSFSALRTAGWEAAQALVNAFYFQALHKCHIHWQCQSVSPIPWTLLWT